MNSDYIKYQQPYARYWFRLLSWDIFDTEKNRLLSKGTFHNLFPELCEKKLAAGEPLPERFELVPREPAKRSVERHGKKIEIEVSL